MTSKFPATFATIPANGGFGSRVTITELLKRHCCATGHFGKWHIGSEQTPGTYGIDGIGTDDGDVNSGRMKKLAADRGRDAHIYDLVTDPTESHNLAARHLDAVKQLSVRVDAWGATLPKEYNKSEDKQD